MKFRVFKGWKLTIILIVVAILITLYYLASQPVSYKFPDQLNMSSEAPAKLDVDYTSNISLLPSYDSAIKDKIIMRRRPYLNDPTCKNFTLSLYDDDTFELTGLVSFPGSGNTWARHIIQLASGIYTGSYYFDLELFAKGFLGEREEWYSGRTIVEKFHEKYSDKMNINRAILLIREPLPAILAFANYLEAGHTGTAFHLPYHQRDWPSFVLQSAYNWLSLAKSWIESPVQLLIIHYEELRLNPVENLLKICNFLSRSCPYLFTPCLKAKLEGSFHRVSPSSRQKTNTFRETKYPINIKNVINRGVDYLNSLLRLHGHSPLPITLYKHYSVD